MRIFRRALAFLLIPFLLLSLLPLNAVQMLSLLVRPFSGKLFRAINRGVCATFFNSLGFLYEEIAGTEVRVSGDTLPPRENSFVISNHQAMADIPALIALARRAGRAGDLKWFVKDPIKWVPGIGWGMLFLDCIYVKRNWTADQGRIEKTFRSLREHHTPFWLVSFLEGTRLTPEKRMRSQDYAKKAGLPPFAQVLAPRTKGFEATLEGLREECQAVYDVTIAYEKIAPGLWSLLLGFVPRLHLHVKRYSVEALPKDSAGRQAWALKRWEEKDARLADFSAHGSLRS